MSQIFWKKIFEKTDVIHFKGSIEQTWQAEVMGGFIVRHVRFDINQGDESNYTQSLVFVPKKE